MKDFDLTTYDVVEMNEMEMSEVDGGGIGIAIGIAAILLFACAMDAY